ncbi:MAG: hypothetical protein NZ920_03340 [Aigarchaeota archaeon]|nr:hypothetical protein [Aigarchaeota archaeon]MDW8092347.1 hypothetical protein [Nitrososphaerota archaeon]
MARAATLLLTFFGMLGVGFGMLTGGFAKGEQFITAVGIILLILSLVPFVSSALFKS